MECRKHKNCFFKQCQRIPLFNLRLILKRWFNSCFTKMHKKKTFIFSQQIFVCLLFYDYFIISWSWGQALTSAAVRRNYSNKMKHLINLTKNLMRFLAKNNFNCGIQCKIASLNYFLLRMFWELYYFFHSWVVIIFDVLVFWLIGISFEKSNVKNCQNEDFFHIKQQIENKIGKISQLT